MWSIRRGCFKQLIRTTRSSELRAEPQWRGAMIDRIKPGNFKCIQTCKKVVNLQMSPYHSLDSYV